MSECEDCVNAIWDNGDSSVGMSAYVEDCKQQSRSIEQIWDEQFEDEGHICPFFIKQLIPERQLHRCTKCNSRHVKFIKVCEDDEYSAEFKCLDCEHVFVNDMWY